MISRISLPISLCLIATCGFSFEKKVKNNDAIISFRVIESRGVQRELQLTRDQYQEVRRLKDKVHEAIEAERTQRNMATGSTGIQRGLSVLRARTIAEYDELYRKEIIKILKNEQIKRFSEIHFQALGPKVFANAEFVRELDLTFSQRSTISSLLQDVDWKEWPEKRKQVLDVLTDEQTSAWKKLDGSPYSRLMLIVPKSKEAISPENSPVDRAVRTWTSANGKFVVKATFLKYISGKVVIKTEDGREISVPIEKLSEQDREYLESVSEN